MTVRSRRPVVFGTRDGQAARSVFLERKTCSCPKLTRGEHRRAHRSNGCPSVLLHHRGGRTAVTSAGTTRAVFVRIAGVGE